MSESAGQPPKPPRTWRPMALWTLAILLAMGLAWFVGAVVVPTWQVSKIIADACNGTTPALTGIERIGGPRAAVHKLRIYLRMPGRIVAHRAEAIDLLVLCGPEAAAAIPEVGKLTSTDDSLLNSAATEALASIRGLTHIVELAGDRIVFRGIDQPLVVVARDDDTWVLSDKLGRYNASREARCQAEAAKALAELRPICKTASATILINSFREQDYGGGLRMAGTIDAYVRRDGNAMIKEELRLRGETIRAELQSHLGDARDIDTGPSGPDDSVGMTCRELLEELDRKTPPPSPQR